MYLNKVELLTFVFWSLLLSNVTLYFSFFVTAFSLLKYVFWAVSGFIAGLLIVNFRRIIVLSLLSYFFSAVIVFVVLSLPVILGTLSCPLLSSLVYSQNLKIIFSATFPFMFLINIMFGVLGGYFGEIMSASNP